MANSYFILVTLNSRRNRVLLITAKTKVMGIFGNPVEHSFSPLMHNQAFAHLKLDCCYLPFKVLPEQLSMAVDAIKALGFSGVNVTIPHKQAVLPYLDKVSPEAVLIGAVNTIVNFDNELWGYNTDGQGFVRSLREDAKVEPAGKTVILLGAGGAARGVGIQLALEGAEKIYLVNRTPEKAVEIAEVITRHTKTQAEVVAWTAEALKEPMRACQILVNTTSLGMYPDSGTIPPIITDYLSPNILVADLVYNPVQTSLLRVATEHGCHTLSGLGMLLYQGAIAFELWTGVSAPVQIMAETLRKTVIK